MVASKTPTREVRALFVSDIHLGSPQSQPEAFLGYLESVQPQSLYLVGDILDGWKLASRFTWTPVCTAIMNRLTSLMRTGTRVFYTPGNHDEFLRDDSVVRMVQENLPRVAVSDEFVHVGVHGRKLLVIHGDRFDVVERRAQWLSKMSSCIYDPLLAMNACVSRLKGVTDRSPYAFCARVKGKVKHAIRFISEYESRVLSHARQKECQGVVCGHIHTPAIVEHGDMIYCNTGDWVEHCVAMVEDFDGTLSLDYYYSRDAFEHMLTASPPSVSRPVAAPAIG